MRPGVVFSPFLHPNQYPIVYSYVQIDKNILFYDGQCGLCQGAVKFVLKWEKKDAHAQRPLYFAALDSPWFSNLEPQQLPDPMPDSIIYLHQNKIVTKSKAAFMLARRLIFPFNLMAVFQYLLPPFLCDWVYDGIAGIRHKIFRRRGDLCDIVPAEWKKRLLV